MTDGLNTIESLPDISFIDGLTLEDIQSRLLTDFVDKYREVTGKKIELSKSDPNRIILLGCAQVIYQGLQNIDKGGKMNFLKYAYGEYLDNMAVFKKVTRNPAKFSTVPLKFKLAQKRESATSIPAGTRVTAAHGVYFATTTYAEIPAGELEITVLAECTEPGSIGDDYAAGELSTLVDPIGFISKVENVQKSTGGAETESDKNMAERVYLAPSSYSTAGPDDAYAYWIKSSNADIGDVKISSPVPGLVDIRFIMMDGSIPEDTLITAAYEYVNQRDKRPLTDNVQILKPTIEEYEIDLIYYINTSDSNSAFAIQSKVKTAVDAYIFWQGSKIGRDINPDELIARIKYAGAKRAIVSEPTFRRIGETAKAECIRMNVVYGDLKMISYYDGQLTDIMPWNIIRNPEVKAISYALQQGCRILYKYSRRLYLYANLEEQPEEIIDLLAAELRTQYYNGALDIKTKRQLVRNTLIWHMTAGTPAAVEELVTVAFGKGEVKEWFEYGDRPYFFKVLIDAIFTPNMDVFFTVNLGKVKNTRSHLRAIEIHRTVEQKIYAGIGHSGYYRPAAVIDGYDVTRKHRQIIYVGAAMADMVRPAAIIDGFQMKGSQVCQSYIGIGTASKARAMDIIEVGMQISMNEEGYYATTI